LVYFDGHHRKAFDVSDQQFHIARLTIAQSINSAGRWSCFSSGSSSTCASREFYGTSENAVKTQIWIAVSVYVLVAIVRKRLGIEAGLYQILQILSLTQFEKTPLLQVLQRIECENDLDEICNQLNLFDL